MKCIVMALMPVFLAGQDRSVLLNNIEKVTTESGEVKYKCAICGSLKSQKAHAENHVENLHFRGYFQYNCKHCGLSFDRRNQLYKHVVSCRQSFE